VRAIFLQRKFFCNEIHVGTYVQVA
jgi:hypothetical protein